MQLFVNQVVMSWILLIKSLFLHDQNEANNTNFFERWESNFKGYHLVKKWKRLDTSFKLFFNQSIV